MRIILDDDEDWGGTEAVPHMKCKSSCDCGTGEVIFYFKWEGDYAGLVAVSVHQYVMNLFSEVKAHKKSHPFLEMMDLWNLDLVTGKARHDENTL